jgi:hypothetical protein
MKLEEEQKREFPSQSRALTGYGDKIEVREVLGDNRWQSQQSRLGVGAVFQAWIIAGEQSSLRTRIAKKSDALLCVRMKS